MLTAATGKQYSDAHFSTKTRQSPRVFFQPKLTVNQPNDIYEQEADHMADKVMRMSSPYASNDAFFKPAINIAQRKCAACEEKEKLQRKESADGEVQGDSGLDSYVAHLPSSGQAMPDASRKFFEPRFGHDFSNVRLHTDAAAAKSAQSINALAYTSGNNIVFSNGQFSPESDSGKRLMAHELTHVVQQGAVVQAKTIQRDTEKKAAVECPATFTIPDDVYKAIGDAWAKSGHGGDTVTENGARIVKDKGGNTVIRTGSGGGGGMDFPPEQAGDTTTGTLHTHPYSKSEGSELGVSFSGTDINSLVGGAYGNIWYVGAGSCNFILNTADKEARDKCKTANVAKRWDDAFAKAGGTLPQRAETAVKAAIVNCGLCYYKSCRPDDKSPIPKTAQLA